MSEHVAEFKSHQLKMITSVEPDGMFPQIQDVFTEFAESFERAEAKEKGALSKTCTTLTPLGKIIPLPGFDSDYDDLVKKIAKLEDELNIILK